MKIKSSKFMKVVVVFAICFATVFSLSGCSLTGVALDREVQVDDMTISVPSNYIELENDSDEIDLFDGPSGTARFEVADSSDAWQNCINIYATWGIYAKGTLESAVESDNNTVTGNLQGYDAQDNIIEKTVIDGYETEAHLFSYKIKSGEKEIENSNVKIYLYSSSKQFEIIIYGDEVDAKKLLETISFA